MLHMLLEVMERIADTSLTKLQSVVVFGNETELEMVELMLEYSPLAKNHMIPSRRQSRQTGTAGGLYLNQIILFLCKVIITCFMGVGV